MRTHGTAQSEPQEAPGLLSDCRVLELSHSAAAVAGRTLADLGAEVIKIEPSGGERARRSEPTVPAVDDEQISLFWLAYNVSKKSVCLDLNDLRGRDLFVRLARSADIVVTDFQRLDIDENDELAALARAANPRLVWTEIWPFGRGEPHERWPAGDLALQALGGHLQLNGDADRRPVRLGLPVALLQSGAEAAAAAMMAYYHRLRTGQGQRVDISAQECITWTLLNTTMTWQLLRREEDRGGDVRKERANKFYTRLVWKCRDGYLTFGPVGGGGGKVRERSYEALVRWMTECGVPDPLLTDRDWNGPGQFAISQEDYDAVTRLIAEFIADRTVQEIMARALPEAILIAPINDVGQVLHDPQLTARGFYSDVDDTFTQTKLRYPARWVHMDSSSLVAPTPAPAAGANTAELLAELDSDILESSGANE
ncbi:MAG TPA: CoA transferase [Pseudonocardiaceae bacterium]|nr:CoA transferase [Pseudonocardiaceae bacterium]